MFNKWRDKLREKKKAEAEIRWKDLIDMDKHDKEYEQDMKDADEAYAKWESLPDTDPFKSKIEEFTDDYIEAITKINKKYFWKHPFNSMWTDFSVWWYYWFYRVPKEHRVRRTTNHDLKKQTLAIYMMSREEREQK